MDERFQKLSWRQLGFQLDEAQRGSDPYHKEYLALLYEANRRSVQDIQLLQSLKEPPEPEPPEGACEPLPEPPKDHPPLQEKVADLTHKGEGY